MSRRRLQGEDPAISVTIEVHSNVNWNALAGNGEKAARLAVKAAAFKAQALVTQNIVDQDLIDTGAMMNGTYITGAGVDQRAEAVASAASLRGGDDIASAREAPGDLEAQVNNCQSYAVYVETTHPFMSPAVEQVRPFVPALVKKALSEAGVL